MRFFTTTVISALAAFASAYTQPDYSKSPEGNAITNPGLNQLVPVGKAFNIEWTPTTQGPISLVLLRGPSSNVVPLETLAESIDNSGKFSWTPSTSLEPDTTHYGLLLVVEGTGQYQWSTQFGISNPGYSGSSSAAPATTTAAATTAVTSAVTSAAATADASSTDLVSYEVTTTICPETETKAKATTTATPTAVSTPSSAPIVGTGSVTVPIVSPSKTPSVPSTLRSSSVPSGSPSSASPSVPVFTGAADRNAISFGAVAIGVAAVLAF
ncbi:hypothetical protein ASPWEDRAFT_169327 [Aspergillus wentii DTO 134E9]|uniref:Yeast cell wall synthesis Kre9/Knh1-like N-terminal domain-containing protein n=1 Tax=Aspergillus wentii DTO 134E9 TaxID=1073089 RepID=A0A1L9RX79_ASPWE|nr:uncharacterized protein ASPWEDRAFT_169327 [Aspergillus wentii DTO 134E9]KAI9931831.1 hypothetical protein MW887_010415 [Aspergillus wentii]OJJ39484.1 hypothetical protein ASPWEDRAFT_169327 [Aspergillus wentii DTO 134E9]